MSELFDAVASVKGVNVARLLFLWGGYISKGLTVALKVGKTESEKGDREGFCREGVMEGVSNLQVNNLS